LILDLVVDEGTCHMLYVSFASQPDSTSLRYPKQFSLIMTALVGTKHCIPMPATATSGDFSQPHILYLNRTVLPVGLDSVKETPGSSCSHRKVRCDAERRWTQISIRMWSESRTADCGITWGRLEGMRRRAYNLEKNAVLGIRCWVHNTSS
jgi:hypothetical protein